MKSKSFAVLFIALIITVLALAGAVWFLSPGIIVGFWQMFRILWVPLVIAAVLFFITCFFYAGGNEKSAVVVVVTGLPIVIGTLVIMSYDRQSTYAESIEVVTMSEDGEELPSFHQRQPYAVASQVSSRTMGNVTGDATGVIKSLPNQEVFTTTVNKRGWLVGYESTQVLKVAEYGSTPNENVEFCHYSENADKRLRDTFIFNSLVREVRHNVNWNTTLNVDDAFAHCETVESSDEKVPHIYMPLIERVGFFNPIYTFGGVAIYNGHTGEVTVEKDYSGDLPMYPSSLAQIQRNSTSYMGDIWDHWFKRVGYEDTSKDENDPNAPHIADFVIADEGLDTTYVLSPLTPRGDAKSIVALGMVESNKDLKSGSLKPYTIYEYADGRSRAANSAVASAITGDILGGYKSSGLAVFEVIPAENGSWTATVGKDQTILYRAEINPEGYITLYNSAGDTVGSNVPGEKVETTDEDTGDPAVEDENRVPVSEMTEEELKALIEESVDELIRRGETPVEE